MVGSALTLVTSFPVLLVGRGLQGIGIGLTALTISVARDHLPAARVASTVALVSVASTVGIGVGYPLAGWLDDVGGVRLAYGAGLAVTVLALVVAAVAIPDAPSGRRAHVDPVGAGLLGLGLVAVVLLVSGTSLGDRHLLVGVGLALLGSALLVGWVVWERRSAAPLVDLGLLRDRHVAAANVAMLVGGAGTYLLLALVTRYVQTPASVGYGFGLSTFEAGLVLVPFSALGFVAGRTAPRLHARVTGSLMLVVAAGSVALAAGVFAMARGLCRVAAGVDGPAGLWRRDVRRGDAGDHPAAHPQGRDRERHEREPGRPRGGVLDRERPGRAAARPADGVRERVPGGLGLHHRGLAVRRPDGRHRRGGAVAGAAGRAAGWR